MNTESDDERRRKAHEQGDREAQQGIMKDSFRRETSPERQHKEEKALESSRRSMVGAPMDPNSRTSKLNLPPGVDSQDLVDPGRSTPDAPLPDEPAAKRPDDKPRDK